MSRNLDAELYDAIVVGGGPAGCAAALTIVEAGASVALVERTRYDNLRCGETVPPTIRRPLEQLGLWARFARSGHVPSLGVESCWGEGETAYRDFVCHPLGAGWHLDRARFDAMLAEEAAARGAHLWSARAMEARDESGRWQVATNQGPLRSRVLINATGRQAGFTMPGAGARWVCDHTVAIGQLFEGGSRPQRTLIESSSDGWAYSAPLPGSRHVLMFFTDPDVLRATSLRSLLAALPHTAARLDGAVPCGPLFRRSANAWCRTQVSGATWLCVGEAASTLDPLSGQGICRALTDGIAAGRASIAMLAEDTGACEEFQARIHRRFVADGHRRLAYYRAERRWTDAAFWWRRHFPDEAVITTGPTPAVA